MFSSISKFIQTSTAYATIVAVALAVSACDDSTDSNQGAIEWPQEGRRGRFVSVPWAKTHLIDNPTFAGQVVIAEVGYGDKAEEYAKGHIPSAIYVNTDEVEYDCFSPRNSLPVPETDPPCMERTTNAQQDQSKGITPEMSLPRNMWNFYPVDHLRKAFAGMGVSSDKKVLLYSKDPTYSARVLMAMRYAGVPDVFILDGGFKSWTEAGHPAEIPAPPRIPVPAFGEPKADPNIQWYTTPQVRSIVTNPASPSVLVDVRTRDEYIGATDPYPYIPTRGRIQGAIYAHGSVETPWEVNYLIDPAGKVKPAQEIANLWATDGVPQDKELVFYCGTGWRGALALLVAESMGWKKLGYYDGGWMKWSMGPEAQLNPIQKDQ